MSSGQQRQVLFLPDTTYYTEDNEKGKELLGIWREMEEELLEKYGFTAEEIKDILDKVIALDAKLAKYVLSSEESSEYVELYHHMIGKTYQASTGTPT